MLAKVLLIIFFSTAAIAEEPLNLTTDISYASKYLIDGFTVGDGSVLQLSVKKDIFKSGFSLMFWTAIQTDREDKRYDEQDFMVLYSRDFFEDSRFKMNLHGFYDYWIYPNSEPVRDGFGDVVSDYTRQGNKTQLGFTFPKMFSFSKTHYLVPTYNAYYLNYYEQGREDRFRGGLHHEMLLEHHRGIKLFIPGATYQYAGMVGKLGYNGGTFNIAPGLSHSVLSIVSGAYALSSIFEMSLNQQWTYKEELRSGNEFWTTFSFIKKI